MRLKIRPQIADVWGGHGRIGRETRGGDGRRDGIGLAIARRVSRDGASVTLLARDEDRLRAAASSLASPTHVAPCDIRQRKTLDRAFDGAVAALGPIHALVAAAGIGGPNADGAGDRFDDLVATNLVGTYSCAQAAVRNLAPGPLVRHIVVVSSILARIGVPGLHGLLRVEGRAARTRAFAGGGARLRERPGERNLPRLGRHGHGVGGNGPTRGGKRRNTRGRVSRCDEGCSTRAHVVAGRRRGSRRPAALGRRARGHRPGDRPERRRPDGLGGPDGDGGRIWHVRRKTPLLSDFGCVRPLDLNLPTAYLRASSRKSTAAVVGGARLRRRELQ